MTLRHAQLMLRTMSRWLAIFAAELARPRRWRRSGAWSVTAALSSTMPGCSTGTELPESDALTLTSEDDGSDDGQQGDDDIDPPSNPTADPCEDGGETCPCSGDEDCASDLVCEDGACWPPLGVCGDGIVDIDEQCDDGPANADDAWCKPGCTLQTCGNVEVEAPKGECDDGNASGTDGCTLSFVDPTVLDPWVLTGGWAIYGEAPTSDLPTVPFMAQGPSLGTDGNRVAPYPGTEAEMSSATTPTFTLPATLHFRSWHVDEGGNDLFDRKRVLVSIDEGATWITLLDCAAGGAHSDLPLCQAEAGPRDATAWDDVALDLEAYAGMAGALRFEYETTDDCCDFEQGWFIDDINALDCPP